MQGHFTLKTPEDLRAKLQRDFDKFKANPLDSDAAFNFFVTAEHMPDWVYPTDRARREAERNQTLLAICSHVANGAKHFEATARHHQSVKGTFVHQEGGIFEEVFPSIFGSAFGSESLIVKLEGNAASCFGSSITALELAEKVLNYWNSHLLR